MRKKGAIKENDLTVAGAAEIMGKGINMTSKLCQSGRLEGAEKIGDLWFVPRESVKNYTLGRRGRKPKQEKLPAELATIPAELDKPREAESARAK